AEAVVETIAGQELLGWDMNFYCLDLTNTAQVRGFGTDEATYLIFCQADDREFEEVEPVFAAITRSLLSARLSVLQDGAAVGRLPSREGCEGRSDNKSKSVNCLGPISARCKNFSSALGTRRALLPRVPVRPSWPWVPAKLRAKTSPRSVHDAP
ncbi:MAG TPA: hypothetical protein VHB99_06580, partial [Pirellulales bacterium]|nr:hypothetical protein [Pirellulales bacterium]